MKYDAWKKSWYHDDDQFSTCKFIYSHFGPNTKKSTCNFYNNENELFIIIKKSLTLLFIYVNS